MHSTGHHVQMRVEVFIENDFQQVFILLVQTIDLLQDKQSRINHSKVRIHELCVESAE